jgi:mono/diheme cytochrome c family protein
MNRIAQWLALGVALGGAAVALVPHPARAEERVLSPTAEAGRQEFNIYCVSCHGEDAKGNGVAAPALKDKPADLTGIAARRGGTFDRVEVAEIVDGRQDMPAHGSREMPIWGDRLGEDATDSGDEESLAQGRVALLVAYLEAIQVPAPAGQKKAQP